MSGGRAVFEAINGPAPGKFLETTHGTTHYVLEGPEDAPMLVVLQHGIGGALSLFDRIAADLALGAIARAEGADASEVAFDGMPHNVFFEDAKPEECSRAICGFVAECF